MGAGALVVCLVGGGVAIATGQEAGPRYRTAIASTGQVEQTIDAVGTIASATLRDAAFPVAGTVATVDVAVGDAVGPGDVLATLDTTALEDALEEAEAALADAEQELEDDLESQTAVSETSSASTSATSVSATSVSATTTATPAPDPATPATDPATPATDPADPAGVDGSSDPMQDPSVVAALAAVRQAQDDLMAQYEIVSAALEQSASSLATSESVCDAFVTASAATVETSDPVDPVDPVDPADPVDPVDPVDPADPVDPVDPVDPADPDPTVLVTDALLACHAAIGQVATDQEGVAAGQTKLLDLAIALDHAVTAAQEAVRVAVAAATTPSGGSTEPAETGPAPSTAVTPSSSATAPVASVASQAGGSETTQVASAADILADRAAIEVAEAEVAIATAARGRVTLTSPVVGTVAAVSMAAGDTVSASSTSAVITVIGVDGYVVETTIAVSDIDTVEIGQSTTLTVASADGVLTGVVSSIGILNASTTSSDPSYTVVVAVDSTDQPLFDGAAAQLTITVGANEGAVTVPTSAVHVDGSVATVQVLADDVVDDVQVTTGVVGAELTEIASGLTVGDEVVLADLLEPLATDDDSAESGLSGLSGSTSEQVPTGGMPARGGPPGSGVLRQSDG